MLTDKIALVTGSGQGIGKEIALRLAHGGAEVIVCDINEEGIQETAKEIEKIGKKSIAIKVDVSDSVSVNECVSKVLDKMKKIDILVNNAGITRDALLVRMKDSDWNLVIRVNLTGTYNFTKAVAKHMMRQRSGKIVNVASVIGLMGNIGQTNYGASKAGIIGFTKSCARELAPRGINVNAVAPGFIETKMTENLPAEVRKRMLENVPLGRLGLPEDVAKVVLFLSSSLSDYLTGQVVNVCGGTVM